MPTPFLQRLMRPHLSHPRAQSLRFYAPRPTYYQGIVRRKPAATSSSQFNSAISRWRQRVNRVNPTYLVYGIIATNVGVFSLWALAESEAQRFGDPGKLRSMMRHWCLSENNLRSGRLWTLVTSTFSHRSAEHLLYNMIGLFFLGLPLAQVIGSATFMSLYLSTGIASGLSFIGFNRLFGPRQRVIDATGQVREITPAMDANGASGSIYGTMAYFAAMNPNATFLIFFILPCPAWAAVSGLVAWDLYKTFGRPGSGVASSAHVGGALSGVAYCLLTRGRLG